MIRTYGLVVFLALIKQLIIFLSEIGAPRGLGFAGYDADNLDHPSFAIEEQKAELRLYVAKRMKMVFKNMDNHPRKRLDGFASL